jgi:hypothetical protein
MAPIPIRRIERLLQDCGLARCQRLGFDRPMLLPSLISDTFFTLFTSLSLRNRASFSWLELPLGTMRQASIDLFLRSPRGHRPSKSLSTRSRTSFTSSI